MQIIILMNSLSIISTSFVAHFYFLLFFFMVIISSKLKAVLLFLMVGWYCPDITKALAEMEKEMSLTSVPSVMLL